MWSQTLNVLNPYDAIELPSKEKKQVSENNKNDEKND